MKPILQSIRLGGSPHGLHNWLGYLACPNRATLNAASEVKTSVSTNRATDVGTILHAFMELYHRRPSLRGENLVSVAFTQTTGEEMAINEEARLEAERLFRAYRIAFGPDEFGEVVAVEQDLGGPEVEKALGVSPFTGRVDLVVKLNAKDVKRLTANWNKLADLVPGYYIVDHKTERGRGDLSHYVYNLQTPTYQLAWNAANSKMPVKGIIYNIIYKTKEVGFERLLVPPPNQIDIEVVRNALAYAKTIKEQFPNRCNPTNCFAWYETCPHFTSGACDRRGK